LLTVDDNRAEDRNPAFTPDGKSVLFLSNRDGETFQVYVVDIKTLVVTRLTDNIRDIASIVFKPIPLAVFAGAS
jgi:Tol biopolymer transport system component